MRSNQLVLQCIGLGIQLIDILQTDRGILQQIAYVLQLLVQLTELRSVGPSGANLFDFLGPLNGRLCGLVQGGEYKIPIVEALATGCAVRELSQIAASAFVALVTTDALVAHALSRLTVALEVRCSKLIALTGLTLLVGITPVVFLALIARPAAKAWFAFALSGEGMTLLLHGTNGITIASLTTLARADLPMIQCTLVAVQTLHIRQTRTLSSEAIAVR